MFSDGFPTPGGMPLNKTLSFPKCGIRCVLFQQELTEGLKQIFCWNGKSPDSTRSLLAEKRVGGENDSLLNNSIAGMMNKTCERPCWCHCRLHVETGIVGRWCASSTLGENGV